MPADGDRFLGSLEIGAAKIAERHPAPAKPVEVARADPQPKETARPGGKEMEFSDADPSAKEDNSDDDDKDKDKDKEKEKAKTKEAPKAAPRKGNASPKVKLVNIPRSAKDYPNGDLQDLARSYEKERDSFRDVAPRGRFWSVSARALSSGSAARRCGRCSRSSVPRQASITSARFRARSCRR